MGYSPSRGLVGRCAVVLGAAALVLNLGVGSSSADPAPVPIAPAPVVPVPPEFDPAFYNPAPETVAGRELGEIIAARQVSLANLVVAPLNVDAWQVSYRSSNTRGEPIAAVATVLKPRGVSQSPRKLLSVQIAEDSLARYCAPSYALQQFSLAPIAGQIVAPAEFVMAQAAVAQGWAVVIPDYQGPNSAYAAGPLGGRITLDGIRAATRFAPLEVAGDSPVGLYGYSGGAIATGHAAELQASYAPEINLVGVAEGGVPADLGAVLNLANNQATSGLVLAAVIGLTREYPEFAQFVDRYIDPLGRALITVKNPLCVQYQSTLLPFLNLKGLLHTPGDPMADPAVRNVVDQTRMGKTTPHVPLFVWNSNPDEIIPVGQVNALVDTYCQDPDARVQYTRDHASEHVVAEISGSPQALLFLRDRLNGVPFRVGCSTFDAGSMALDPAGFQFLTSVLGETVAALFGKPIGA